MLRTDTFKAYRRNYVRDVIANILTGFKFKTWPINQDDKKEEAAKKATPGVSFSEYLVLFPLGHPTVKVHKLWLIRRDQFILKIKNMSLLAKN